MMKSEGSPENKNLNTFCNCASALLIAKEIVLISPQTKISIHRVHNFEAISFF